MNFSFKLNKIKIFFSSLNMHHQINLDITMLYFYKMLLKCSTLIIKAYYEKKKPGNML